MVSPELRQAKAALQARRRQLRDELKRVDEAIESLDRVLGSAPQRASRRGSVKAAVAEILKENAGVMHADEILDMVRGRGIELSGQDPKATIVTALIRLRDKGEVMSLGRNKWRWRSPDLAPGELLKEVLLEARRDALVE
jgi:hypothetical protein